jgi:beta-glucanase (GH16 family)
VFDDDFGGTTLDSSKWNTFMTSNAANGWPWFDDGAGGSAIGPAGSFDAEFCQPSQVVVNDGLSLIAVRGSTKPGYAWTSGLITTYGKFEFNGGYLQVAMEQPHGAGAWPGIWLLPGASAGHVGDNFEIDAQEGGFSGGSSPDQNLAWHLHQGSATFGGVTSSGTDLTSGYHVFGLSWVSGQSLTYYVDGRQLGQLTAAQATIPNEPMEIILNLAVAQGSTGWHPVYDSSTPSPMVLHIREVQVYK